MSLDNFVLNQNLLLLLSYCTNTRLEAEKQAITRDGFISYTAAFAAIRRF